MRLVAAILFGTTAWGQTPLAEQPKLAYVLILIRHGVRSPTATNEALRQYASEPWPEWGVAPGELTEHGRRAMETLGVWYRGWLSQDGLLPESGCAAEGVYVRADVGQRTTESARALARGMFPGCALETHTAEGDADPLFHPVAAGVAHGDAALATGAVLGRMGGHAEAAAANLQRPFGVLRGVLFGCVPGPPCPAEKQPGKRALLDLKPSVEATEDGLADIQGPLRTGSTLAENLMLEYADGKRGNDLGWGRLDAARLYEIMAIHTSYADLARRTTYLARLQGSNLMKHILLSMEQAVSGKTEERVRLLVGHDTNIAHVAGMLNLSWALAGYERDDTPPGGALVFRMWRDARGNYAVESLYVAQTLEQLRESTMLSRDMPPASTVITVPGCGAAPGRYGCNWDAFRRAVAQGLDSKN